VFNAAELSCVKRNKSGHRPEGSLDIIRRMFPRLKSASLPAGIAAALVVTILSARLFSVLLPRVHWEPFPGMHIHHYVYGIFILAVAGYLALIFGGARAKSWIALLYGLGLGLTFDEFGMWIDPPFVRGVRWHTTGLAITLIACALAGLLPILLRRTRGMYRSLEAKRWIQRSAG
jgi:hypothetical protein